MKHFQSFLLLLSLTLFFSCRKNFSDETFTPVVTPVIPDFAPKSTASVSGFVTDANGNPVFNAQVVAGNKQTVTDGYGYFFIEDAQLNKAAGLIKIVHGSYYTSYRSFTVNEGKTSFTRIQLLSKTVTGTVNAAAGGTVTTTDGAKVELPADAVVVASNGAAYNGTIKIASKWIDPTVVSNFQSATPGDNRGVNSDGHLVYTKSHAVIAVELSGDIDQKLQIAAGKKATITIPIPASIAATAPASIALWSFDETTACWKQESTATKTGNTYVGQVSHFSYWEGAIGLPLVNFTARVLNSSLQPLSNVPVVITQANVPQNAGYGKFGYTDMNGYVYGVIPANMNLVLDVMTTCATTAYSVPFSTTNSNIDLGAVTGNAGQNTVTIAGTAVNCSNAPVTNGYVQVYDNGFNNRIPIVNGTFSFTGLACTNTTASYVVVDNSTNLQSQPQTITLNAGTNNLGQLTACGTSTISTINYTIDANSYTWTEPARKPAGFYTPQGYTQMVGDIMTNANFSFNFDGGDALGNGHQLIEVFSPDFAGGRAISSTPLAVTITEFGAPGGFISGSFSGVMNDFVSNTPYNVSFNFRVRRYN